MTAFDTWYDQYHRRIYDWTGDCSVRSAEVVLMLPDLVHLLLDLSQDSHVPPETRALFHQTAQEVMRGVDYLPQGVVGTVGLIEDAVRVAKQLQPALPSLPPETIHTYWQGERPLPEAVDYLLTHRDHFAPRC